MKHRLGAFHLDARFEAGGGLIALFGRSDRAGCRSSRIIAGQWRAVASKTQHARSLWISLYLYKYIVAVDAQLPRSVTLRRPARRPSCHRRPGVLAALETPGPRWRRIWEIGEPGNSRAPGWTPNEAGYRPSPRMDSE